MKTDIIHVSVNGSGMNAALAQAEKVAAYKGLSPRSEMHLRLLAEEMMGMMRSITGPSQGEFWLEDKDGTYELHLRVMTRMDSEKREKLLSASSTGKNEAARGLMGRLRDFFDRGADEDIAAFSSPLMLDSIYEQCSTPALDYEWTMQKYQDALSDRIARREPEAMEAWDELEKSVVSHVADDIRVNIRGQWTEMIILKKLD